MGLKEWVSSKASQARGVVGRGVRSEYQSYKKKRLMERLAREEGRAVMKESYEKAKEKQYEKYGKLKAKYELEPEMERIKAGQKQKKELEKHSHEVLFGGMGPFFGSKSKRRVSDGIGNVYEMKLGGIHNIGIGGIGEIGTKSKVQHDGIGTLNDLGFGFKKRKK